VRVGVVLFVLGVAALAAAAAADPTATGSAARATWPPFVLVAGLLLIGVAAQRDGLFTRLGGLAARVRAHPVALLAALLAVVAAVTTVLNLDTSAAFLTPVLVLAARRRGISEEPFLYGALLMSNSASLLLPGSNLTNLLVLANEHVPGAQFAARMLPAWAVAVVVTAAFVAFVFRADLRNEGSGDLSTEFGAAAGGDMGGGPPDEFAADRGRGTAPHLRDEFGADRGRGTAPHLPGTSPAERIGTDSVSIRRQQDSAGLGGWSVLSALAVAAAVGLMLAVRSPAPWVVAVGAGTAAVALGRRTVSAREVWDAVEPLSLAGVFGVAVALGALARGWSGPAHLMAHAGAAASAALGAGAAVVVNNLPAAVLLGSRHPAHARALLLGLNLGPNLAVTGSLSSLIWWRAATNVGARPSARRLTQLGGVLVPVSIAASATALWLVSPARL